MSDDNIVKFTIKQNQQRQAAGLATDPINPKSLLNMTEVEQELFLNNLRDRRIKAALIIAEADRVRTQASSLRSLAMLNKKQDQAQRQYDKASKAFDKLEQILYELRALSLQYTDVDITRVLHEHTTTPNPPKAG